MIRTKYNNYVKQKVRLADRDYFLLVHHVNYNIKNEFDEKIDKLDEKTKKLNHELIGLRVENIVEDKMNEEIDEDDNNEIIDLLGKRNRRMQEDE